MERRHEYELTSRLEMAKVDGSAYISEAELRLWYGKKIAAGTYKDLYQRWAELFEYGDVPKLLAVVGKGGWFLFNSAANLFTINADGWSNVAL